MDITLSCTVYVYLDVYICFLGYTAYFCDAFTCKKYFCYLIPCNSFVA